MRLASMQFRAIASTPAGDGRFGLEECTQRQADFVLVQLGRCAAHGAIATPCNVRDHVKEVREWQSWTSLGWCACGQRSIAGRGTLWSGVLLPTGCSTRDSLILKVGSRHHGWQQETTKDNFLLPHLNAHSPRRESVVPHPQCVDVGGAATLVARRQKQRGHAELAGDHGRARLVVLACQVKGRWSDDCHFLRQLSQTNARQEPPFLQHRVRHTWLLF